jgi:RNA recognition motif-containing protein
MKSRCYGYIWFQNEKAAKLALEDSASMPYQVDFFKPMCIRECEPRSTNNQCTMLISNYPEDYNEKALRNLIGDETIQSIRFSKKKSEVTFKSVLLAKRAEVLDGCPFRDRKLSCRPIDLQAKEKLATDLKETYGSNNLYIKELPKHLPPLQVRRAFARYGRISSFNLIDKPSFATNIAFVGYYDPSHAATALSCV